MPANVPEPDLPSGLSVAITKRLGAFHLRPRFAVGRELIVLFGHSGSGKSLTLRAVAGLMRPDAGRIMIAGTPVFDAVAHLDLPPQERGVGMVVQSYALFPHLTVRDNIGFGLHRLNRQERSTRVAELADLLAIGDLLDRKPGAISGGQAQRVALARALAPRPRLLLLDEPFSALDSAIRVNLRRELARLKHDLDLTIVFVTHDLREAYNLADQIAVFDQGVVLQAGARDDVFNRPASARVAELTEMRNIWPGEVLDERGVRAGGITFRTERLAIATGMPVDVCIRPERVLLIRPERVATQAMHDAVVTGSIIDEVAHGASYTLCFRVEGTPGTVVEVDIPAHPYEVLGVAGQRRWALAFPREAVHVMPATGSE